MIGHLYRYLLGSCRILAAIPICVVLLMTFVGVFMRYVFADPITGSGEIIKFAMALVVFAGLPSLTREHAHITVSLFDGMLSRRLLKAKQILCDLVSIITLAVIAWQLYGLGMRYALLNDRTIMLNMPEAPLVFVMTALTVLTIIALLVTNIVDFLNRDRA